MEKFRNKYRIPSARFQHWDYRWAGAYFITICTKNRWHYFGEIANQQMQLSHVGIIADVLWHQIPYHAENVELGEFVVMPNHTHGILVITQNGGGDGGGGDGDGNDDGNAETGHALSLRHALSLPQPANPMTDPSNDQPESKPKTIGQQRYQNIGKNSISAIVGSYKSTVTKNAHRLGFEFEWQTRFHDHIIRDDASFQRISN